MSDGDEPRPIDRLEINTWTQPMHLFLDGSDAAYCGLGLAEACNQGDEEDNQPRKFSASNNYRSVDDVAHFWGEHDDSVACPGCAGAITEVRD